jgi:hypothetical protein
MNIRMKIVTIGCRLVSVQFLKKGSSLMLVITLALGDMAHLLTKEGTSPSRVLTVDRSVLPNQDHTHSEREAGPAVTRIEVSGVTTSVASSFSLPPGFIIPS